MEQATKHTESVKLPFSRPTLKRLKRMDESALRQLLDDFEADQEVADAIAYNKKNEPNDFISSEEMKEDWKKRGIL